jgi:hypothetical protein
MQERHEASLFFGSFRFFRQMVLNCRLHGKNLPEFAETDLGDR